MRVLITGSRTWQDERQIHTLLDYYLELDGSITVVHGDCPLGADRMARNWCEQQDPSVVTEERYPADWDTYGKRAGFLRNALMVDLGADLCLAFIKSGSKGATMCSDLAAKAVIPVKRFVVA